MTNEIPRRQIKRRRRKRTKNNYFTKVHEDAIIRYCKTTCNKERSALYESLIKPAFDEMVEKIIFTYKFNILPNIESLRDDCKIWLTTILNKYDPNKCSKAFSYFSVVTKNWFIHKVKQKSKKMAQYKLRKLMTQNKMKKKNGKKSQRTQKSSILLHSGHK